MSLFPEQIVNEAHILWYITFSMLKAGSFRNHMITLLSQEFLYFIILGQY